MNPQELIASLRQWRQWRQETIKIHSQKSAEVNEIIDQAIDYIEHAERVRVFIDKHCEVADIGDVDPVPGVIVRNEDFEEELFCVLEDSGLDNQSKRNVSVWDLMGQQQEGVK